MAEYEAVDRSAGELETCALWDPPSAAERAAVYRGAGWQRLPPIERGGLLLVAEGLKPAAAPVRDVARAAPLVSRLGLLLWPLGRSHAVTTPGRGEALEKKLCLAHQHATRGNTRDATADASRDTVDETFGWFFGIPTCCSRAFHDAKRRGLTPGETPLLRWAAQGGTLSEPLLLALAFYRPCDPACPASRALGRAWREALHAHDPAALAALLTLGRRRRQLAIANLEGPSRLPPIPLRGRLPGG